MDDYEEAELLHETAFHDWMLTFNETLNIEDAFKVMPDIIRIPAVGFCCIVLVLGVLGNILVTQQTVKSSTLSTAVKSLTLSLTAADLLLLVICLPLELLYFNAHPWYLGQFGCKAVSLITEMSRFIWISTVTVLCFQRHLAAGRSTSSRWLSREQYAPMWTLVVWIVSVAFAIPFAVVADVVDFKGPRGLKETHCVIAIELTDIIISYSTSFAFFCCVPIIALILLQCFVRHRLNAGVQSYTNDAYGHLSGVMAVVYFLCTIPRSVQMALSFTGADLESHDIWMEVLFVSSTCLFYATAIIHPILSPVTRNFFRKSPYFT